MALSDSASIFVPAWRPPELMKQIVGLTARARPTICYVGAARGDDPRRILEFHDLGKRVGFIPRVLSFFDLEQGNPDRFFAGADIIYVDGGSTRNLLAILREWNADDALTNAYRSGTPIVGASAGASIMFEWCLTDSVRSAIRPHRGLGLVQGSFCPHHDARLERRLAFSEFVTGEHAAFPAWALDDGTALIFENEALQCALAVNEDAGVVRLDERSGIPSRVPVDPIFMI